MPKYDVTYACGHTGEVELFGKADYREWKLGQIELDICPKCRQKERDEQNRINAEANKVNGFAELKGSPKQIAWAETIRAEQLPVFEDYFKAELDMYDDEPERSALIRIRDKFLHDYMAETSASKIIDMRNDTRPKFYNDKGRVISIDRAVEIEAENPSEPEPVHEAIVAEPEEVKHPGCAVIQEEDGYIILSYDRDDEFMDIMHDHDYIWSRNRQLWRRQAVLNSKSTADAICAIGNDLLNHGFRVQFPEAQLMELAVSGEFEPDSKRYVYVERGDKLSVNFREDDESAGEILKMFDGIARRIYPKYGKYDLAVDVRYWREVMDLEELFDFHITDYARRKMSEQVQNTRTVSPAKVKQLDARNGLKDILNSSREIIDDLKD